MTEKQQELIKEQSKALAEFYQYVAEVNASEGLIIFFEDVAHCGHISISVRKSRIEYTTVIYDSSMYYGALTDKNNKLSQKIINNINKELITLKQVIAKGYQPTFINVTKVCIDLIDEQVYIDKETEVTVISIPSKTQLLVKADDEPYLVDLENVFILQ